MLTSTAAHVARPRRELSAQAFAVVVPASTTVMPYEKFMVQAELDGRFGRHRASKDICLLAADNDHAASGTWLASKAGAKHDTEELSSTQLS